MFNFRIKKHNRSVYSSQRESSGRSFGVGKKNIANRAVWLGRMLGEIDWSRVRINAVALIFFLSWLGLWGRAWYLQMLAGPSLADRARRQHMATELVTGRRGVITDRNGLVLARSVEATSVYARPRDVEDPKEAARLLAPILGKEPERIYEELAGSKRRFIWLKRKVDDYAASRIRKANLPGIGLSKEFDRVYPFKHMAGQLLGFVGVDDTGLEGIERSMEARLGTSPVRQLVQRDAMGRRFYLNDEVRPEPRGADVRLTLDMQIQYFAEEAVAKAAREYDSSWAGALVVDVPTGDILAWAQYPFFNPNIYRQFSPQVYRNRLAADALEPGSTLKPLIMAAALQENRINPGTLIDCEQGRWESKKFLLRDTSVRGILPASKVLRYSSNIGMAKIGLNLGAPLIHKYLSSLGFGEHSSVQVADSRGILRRPRDWNELDVMSTSFGQSISVSCLQLAQAYLTLLNNGVYKPLRLVLDADHVEEKPERIFSERTAREVMKMMRDVVEEGDGTGRRARVEGVSVGGKTGTAQKADRRAGTYGSGRLASFVGFLPSEKPRYLILVMVDEPTRNQYGSVVAAPVFSEIAGKTLGYAGLLQTRTSQVIPRISRRERGLKMSGPDIPFLAETQRPDEPGRATRAMEWPGHLAKAPGTVPDVLGKSVRNAVELFARAGIVPQLKGSGNRVVRQVPEAGTPWSKYGKASTGYMLWLSES